MEISITSYPIIIAFIIIAILLFARKNSGEVVQNVEVAPIKDEFNENIRVTNCEEKSNLKGGRKLPAKSNYKWSVIKKSHGFFD